MVNVYVSGVSIDIGRQLENEAREIYFDLSGLEETYGQGTATLVHLRPSDAAPYICTTRVYGQYLVWTVTNTDTAFSGSGKCELRWVVGETLAKSIIYTTTIAPSITGAEEVPDPYESWYEALLEHISEYDIASDQIEANTANIATNTANIATNTADIATNTANIATNTSNIATNASDIAVLEGRMDEFTTLEEGSTTGDAELVDIRVGADGTQYANAGDAVRGQVTNLKSDITSVMSMTDANLLSGVAWEIGTINASTGNTQAANNRVRTVDYIDLTGVTAITLSILDGYKYVYDTYNENHVLTQMTGGGAWNTSEKTLVIPSNVKYLKLLVSDAENGVANISFADNLTGTYKSKIISNVEDNTNSITQNQTEINDLTTALDAAGIFAWSEELEYAGIGSQTIYRSLNAGEMYDFVLTFSGTTSDGGQKNVQVYDDSGARIGIYYGSVNSKITIPRNTEYLRVVVSRTGTWAGWGVMVKISKSAQSPLQHVYHVEKDGSGDFTKLTDAISAAEQYTGSVVYVGAGTWDVLGELGTAYLDAVSETDKSTWGIILKNRIHLIFSTQAEVTANYTGNNDNVRKYLSVFNSGEGGFTLENCRIRSSNIRYCVHDDPGLTTAYQNKYIHCDMYHDNSGNTAFGGWQCIGGGFSYNSEIIVDGCVFDGHNQYSDIGGILSYHNSSLASAMSKLVVKNCYFKGAFTVRVSWLGTSTKITNAYITGCRLGAVPTKTAENTSATVENVDIIAWNNDIAS